jgi:ketosteroid isomerase-like protein
MSPRRSLGLLALCALAACQKAETPEQMAARISAASDTAKTAIEAQNARFSRYVAAGQGDSVAMLYTTDGTAMPPNMPTVTRREAIATMMNQMGAANLTLTAQAVWSDGEVAIERGTFAFSITPPSGPAMTSAGKYMVHWKKVGGEWLLHQDIWNDDAPMAMPAAAPARRH